MFSKWSHYHIHHWISTTWCIILTVAVELILNSTRTLLAQPLGPVCFLSRRRSWDWESSRAAASPVEIPEPCTWSVVHSGQKHRSAAKLRKPNSDENTQLMVVDGKLSHDYTLYKINRDAALRRCDIMWILLLSRDYYYKCRDFLVTETPTKNALFSAWWCSPSL